jgi:ABC-type dipeptide/oligopeptide/nickel transport system permease subunit
MSPAIIGLKNTLQPSVRSRLLRVVPQLFRRAPFGVLSAFILLLLVIIAVLAQDIAPFDPLKTNFSQTRKAPSLLHIAGTDNLGRDSLSRLIHGARITLFVAGSSVLIGDSVGFALGILSGYSGKKVDVILQRILEILLAFPTLILAMLLLIGLGAGLRTVIVAIAVTRVPGTCRVVRSVVLSVREYQFVDAARALGASPWRVMVRHVAPQCVAPWLVLVTVNLGAAIFAEAALSFLGIGIQPPAPSWGNMLGGVLAEAFKPPWWLVVFPGMAITVTVLCCNLLGDSLRDLLDPRVRKRLG